MSEQLSAYESAEGVSARIPLRRMGAPADMAGAALYLASPAGAWVTGIVLPVDGGFLAKL
jgi:NAD(P)-dependent dehydrogenase (short-subunit alcohol dehydrogenase family)